MPASTSSAAPQTRFPVYRWPLQPAPYSYPWQTARVTVAEATKA